MTDTGKATLPALPAFRPADPALQAWVRAVTERLEVREGARGNLAERVVTARDFEAATGISLVNGGSRSLRPGEFPVDMGNGVVVGIDVNQFAETLRDTRLYHEISASINEPARVSAALETIVTQQISALASPLKTKIDSSSSYTLTGVIVPQDSGAMKVGSIAWDVATGALTGGTGIAITEKGIIGAKAGAPTFSISSATGDATFTGEITGSVVTGGTIRTAASGTRVELSSTNNRLDVYNGATNVAQLGGSSGGVLYVSGSSLPSVYATGQVTDTMDVRYTGGSSRSAILATNSQASNTGPVVSGVNSGLGDGLYGEAASDNKAAVRATGRLEATKTIRVTGKATMPASGVGGELLYDTTGAGATILQSYDRGASAYKVLYLSGSTVFVNGGSGLQVEEGFGCNGKTPQTEVTVNAASTDLASVVALCNQLRSALIANGIVV